METIPSKPDRPNVWKEVKRTPDMIELHDPNRNIGMRLFTREAKVDYDYKPTRKATFSDWNEGAWYDPARVNPADDK